MDVLLGFRVQGSSCFVKKDNAGILQDGAGNGDALLLTPGKTETTFADLCVILVGKGQYLIVDTSCTASFVDLFICGISVGILEVVPETVC